MMCDGFCFTGSYFGLVHMCLQAEPGPAWFAV